MRYRTDNRALKQAPQKLTISKDEILACYAQGEEAVIVLVESLVARINALEKRIEVLENQKSKDSKNSSKPSELFGGSFPRKRRAPSGDGFAKRTKSLRTKSGRKSGGQKDHPGSTLEWCEEVDEVFVYPVVGCKSCGASLENVEVLNLRCSQVHELPPIKLVVHEHQAEEKCCPKCGVLNQGKLPAFVNSLVQYGPGLKGLMVYLMEGQLLPSERARELLKEVIGCEISEATLYNTRLRCYEELAAVEAYIKSGIQVAPVVHFDETGLRVKSKLMWLHVACNGWLTAYFIDLKRGQLAMDAIDILPNFEGVSVHDGLASYGKYDSTHALCNAHHLRELRFVVERYEQDWASDMMTLLVEIKTNIAIAQAAEETSLTPTQIADFERRYREIIEAGLIANPFLPIDPDLPTRKGRRKQTPPKNLLDRLQLHQSAVLLFMYDWRVPFDNNQAERDLRMMKLKQKISGTFRSMEGAQQFCRIRGYISTLRKQGIQVLDALRLVLMETPLFPSLQPE
jgi:transposase